MINRAPIPVQRVDGAARGGQVFRGDLQGRDRRFKARLQSTGLGMLAADDGECGVRSFHLLMDRACEGRETRQLALDLDLFQSSPRAHVLPLGNTTGPCTGGAMKSSGCFGVFLVADGPCGLCEQALEQPLISNNFEMLES